jgi:hypothetical protein
MNAVEIEQAVSELAAAPFDAEGFPFAFLEAFGHKQTTLQRLRKGSTNQSDVGGVLQRNHIHIAVSPPGDTGKTLGILRDSSATQKYKAKFILSTDGQALEAEDLVGGETLACAYHDLPDHFGFFLALAGISTVREVRENAFDIKATARLNRLYVQLLQDNPDWAGADHREAMNHFMARLIFCFFAEDTSIFSGEDLFTDTVVKMSSPDSSNTHEVIGEIFRSMNTPLKERDTAKVPRWAKGFPYVNGGLFHGEYAAPEFSKIARSYLVHIGSLDWTLINPDIFGSMIQAVADEDERGDLGMHYTSVPNILKVLDPLFLDDARDQLKAAGDNPRKLLNLRKRLARIRVFDPAAGSGNFLVTAYKQLRDIENAINERRGEPGRKSDIRLTNFRGVELRHFSAEIARLALIIAEYQCDVAYLGQKKALLEFLPLATDNWITCGNALRLDWLSICPPTGSTVKLRADDLFGTPLDQAEIDFENEGGETYICGNPPYLGSTWQSKEQKDDLRRIFEPHTKNWKSLDYVAGWFMKAAEYGRHTQAATAFVATNSICQGQQVPILWPLILESGHAIHFAHASFKWANLASHNAGVTVVIVGISANHEGQRRLFAQNPDGSSVVKVVDNINPYLAAGPNIIVSKAPQPISELPAMTFGSKAVDGGNLFLSREEIAPLGLSSEQQTRFVRRFYGSSELIKGDERYCLWIDDDWVGEARSIPSIAKRIKSVEAMRRDSKKKATRALAETPHRFGEARQASSYRTIVVPRVSSEGRDYLPVGIVSPDSVVGDRNFALYDAPLWNMALIASRLHWVWIGAVCVRMRTDFSYSNTLGWNTFPVPKLTSGNKENLTRCAEDILLAREHHFPASIADLYAPVQMPSDLREAHEQNDETLERIYIGRRFRNDTERLEKLFSMYAEMTQSE